MLLTGSKAAAHKDYAGDVHPFVVVEKGHFVICFDNNQEDKRYRMVLSAVGKVISPRHPISDAEFADYDTRYERRELGGRRYVFPTSEGEHNGKPFYDIYERGRRAERVQLPWGERKIGIVHDMLVSERDVVFLVTPELQLYRFDRADAGGTAISSLRLGEPSKIYDCPCASNIARSKYGYLVCWIDKSQRLLVTLWEPSKQLSRTAELLPRTGWNTTISIAVIGDELLIARHGLTPGIAGSQIKTILKKLPL